MAAVTVTDTALPSLPMMDPAHSSLKVECGFYYKILAGRLVDLWKAGELCDYVIKGTDESFSIHSPVLAALSPVFKSMLMSDMKESAKRDGACTFPEIQDAIMKKLLEAAYTGTCSVAREELVPLIAAAHYLGMSTLLTACEKLIPKLLCPSNCFSWTRIAKTFELNALVSRIQTRMRTSHEEVIQSGEFSEAEGAEVSVYLRDLVWSGIHSDVAVAAAVQWIERDPESRAVHMPELFLSASIADCTRPFLLQVMREKSDIIQLQQNNVMHKLILEQILVTESLPPTNLLILGGQNGYDDSALCNDCWILKDDHLVKYAAGPGEEMKPNHSICQVPQGVMVTGGDDSSMCKLLDVVQKTWIDKASLLNARSRHASGYLDGNVFVCAGSGPKSAELGLQTVDYMEVAENKWLHGPDLPVTACNPKLTVCNSKLYVLINCAGTLYCLDWASKAWTQKSPLLADYWYGFESAMRPESPVWFSMTTVDDRIFVAGGYTNLNCMYTPETDSWCSLTGPPVSVHSNVNIGSLVYHKKKLYLIAGCGNHAQTDVMEYDIGADKWAMSPWNRPNWPLRYHAAFVVNVSL